MLLIAKCPFTCWCAVKKLLSRLLHVQVEPSEEVVEQEVEIQLPQPFQQLFVSCPDGLTVTYMLESAVG